MVGSPPLSAFWSVVHGKFLFIALSRSSLIHLRTVSTRKMPKAKRRRRLLYECSSPEVDDPEPIGPSHLPGPSRVEEIPVIDISEISENKTVILASTSTAEIQSAETTVTIDRDWVALERKALPIPLQRKINLNEWTHEEIVAELNITLSDSDMSDDEESQMEKNESSESEDEEQVEYDVKVVRKSSSAIATVQSFSPTPEVRITSDYPAVDVSPDTSPSMPSFSPPPDPNFSPAVSPIPPLDDRAYSSAAPPSSPDNCDSAPPISPPPPAASPNSLASFSLSPATTEHVPANVERVWYGERPSSFPVKIPFTGGGEKFFPQIDTAEPIEWFSCLLDDEWILEIVRETNAYAILILMKGSAPRSRIGNFKPVTVPEFKVFLGVMIHMGIVKLPTLNHYWRKDKVFDFPTIRAAIGRDRFLLILQCLHFAGSTSDEQESQPEDTSDYLRKFRPFLNRFEQKMRSVYRPDRALSIDESMVLWRGRLSIRQYIKNKRHKYGIKLYMLTDPNGMVLRILVYQGGKDRELGGVGHTKKVVLKLLNDFLGQGYSVYMDNYYNSVDLAEILLEKRTYCTGTLRSDRIGNPLHLKQPLKKGQKVEAFSNTGVSCSKWRDKRDVHMISTEFGSEISTFQSRRTGKTFEKPNAIKQYNNNMSGVDLSDQLMSYYLIERKTIKWYKKLVIHLIDILVVNSFKLYKRFCPTPHASNLLDFRCLLVESLESHSTKRKTSASCSTPITKIEIHVAGRRDQDVPKAKRNRRCVVCYNTKKTNKFVPTFCDDCPNNPHLCLPECFRLYHEY